MGRCSAHFVGRRSHLSGRSATAHIIATFRAASKRGCQRDAQVHHGSIHVRGSTRRASYQRCQLAAVSPTSDPSVNKVQIIEIDEAADGQRLDNFLMRHLKGLPRSRVYRIVRRGEVRVNGSRATPSRRLAMGDRVRVPPVRLGENRPNAPPPVAPADVLANLQSQVVYEDGFYVVLNKPDGLASHGGSGIRLGAIEQMRQIYGPHLELGHRLDRGTSGCLLLTRKRAGLVAFHDAQRAGLVSKHYLLVASGNWPRHAQEIDAPIARGALPSGERLCRVARDGKPAVTRFQVLGRTGDQTLLRAEPVTGRTHQIRVHCQHVGCPIVGDAKYGKWRDEGARAPRMMLHASRLVVPKVLEVGNYEFTAALDGPMQDWLEDRFGPSDKYI